MKRKLLALDPDLVTGAALAFCALAVVLLVGGCDAAPLADPSAPVVTGGERAQAAPAEEVVPTAVMPAPMPAPAPVSTPPPVVTPAEDPPAPGPQPQQVCPPPLLISFKREADGLWTISGRLDVSMPAITRVTVIDFDARVGADAAVNALGGFTLPARFAKDRELVGLSYRVEGGCTSVTWCWRMVDTGAIDGCPVP